VGFLKSHPPKIPRWFFQTAGFSEPSRGKSRDGFFRPRDFRSLVVENPAILRDRGIFEESSSSKNPAMVFSDRGIFGA
jgi:hypothetical protein